jgi:hypothetical protein
VRCGASSPMASRAEQRRDRAIKRLLELAPQMLFGSSSQTYRTYIMIGLSTSLAGLFANRGDTSARKTS